MKKVILLVIVIALGGIASIGGESLDFVILLDVSESMLPYFDDTVDYLIRDIVTEHLTTGDTFHLLSFASLPEIELTRTISPTQDSEPVLARIMLLQPLGQYTDLISALRFLQSYVGRLEIGTDKKILILTDGEHDPPPGSPYPASAGDLIEEETSKIAREMADAGWDLGLVQFPVDSAKTSENGESDSQNGSSNEPSRVDATPANESTGESVVNSDTFDNSSGANRDLVPETTGDSAGTTNSEETSDTTSSNEQVTESTTLAEASPEPTNSSANTTQSAIGETGGEESTGSAESGVDDDADGSNAERGILAALADGLGVETVEFSGELSESRDISNEATGSPRLVFPDYLGSVRRRFTVRFELIPFDDTPLPIRVSSVFWDGIDILVDEEKVTLRGEPLTLRTRLSIPDSVETGETRIPIRIEFADDLRIFPREGVLEFELVEARVDMERLLRVLGIIGVVIVGIGIIVVLSVLVRRIISSTLSPATASPAIRFKEISPGESAIEMVVEGQNRKIGTRNVHVIRKGSSRSIGGGKSSFVIFAYPVRTRVAELRRSEDQYIFIPRHKDSGIDEADESGSAGRNIENCIGRPIRIRSVRGAEVSLKFLHYVSPLERINRIMHSIDGPGRLGK